MSILTPVYFDKQQIRNILSATGKGYAPIQKTTTSEDKTGEAKIKLGGEGGVEVGLDELLQWFAKAKASGNITADFDAKGFLKHAVETTLERENTEFGLFYQELPELKKSGQIKEINFENRDKKKGIQSGDFVEFKCTFMRNSIKDTLDFISQSINLFSKWLDSYLENTFEFDQGESQQQSTESLHAQLAIGYLNQKQNYIRDNPDIAKIFATKTVIDEVIPLLESSDVNELRGQIAFHKKVQTLILLEKHSLIGSIEKLYGNEFSVVGKVIKYEPKGEYSPLESTIFSQLNDDLLKQIEGIIGTINGTLKGAMKGVNIESQIRTSSENIRMTNTEVMKILPVAIYC